VGNRREEVTSQEFREINEEIVGGIVEQQKAFGMIPDERLARDWLEKEGTMRKAEVDHYEGRTADISKPEPKPAQVERFQRPGDGTLTGANRVRGIDRRGFDISVSETDPRRLQHLQKKKKMKLVQFYRRVFSAHPEWAYVYDTIVLNNMYPDEATGKMQMSARGKDLLIAFDYELRKTFGDPTKPREAKVIVHG
jgi:hypothetical protein